MRASHEDRDRVADALRAADGELWVHHEFPGLGYEFTLIRDSLNVLADDVP